MAEIYLAQDDPNAGDAVIKNDKGKCFSLVGNSTTAPDTYSADSSPDCDDCLTTCVDPVPDLFVTLTVTANLCGTCDCADLPDEAVLEYQGGSVWTWNNGSFSMTIVDDTSQWVLEIECIDDSTICTTFTQAYGACPYPDPSGVWAGVTVTCVTAVVMVIWVEPMPVPSPSPANCNLCDCKDYTVTIAGFTGSGFCNGCLCNTFNGTYDLINLTGVNENNKIGVMQCLDGDWYFTAQCPTNFNCVRFTAPDTDGCPPEAGWTLVPDPFKACNNSDGDAATMGLVEACPAVCPSDNCSACNDSYVITLSGFSGCPFGEMPNGAYNLTRTGGTCIWTGFNGGVNVDVRCTGADEWAANFFEFITFATGSKIGSGACMPLGSWTIISDCGTTGSMTVS